MELGNSTNADDRRPIGVFDSGIGGITVLRELIQTFPSENFIYLGDTARLPYGSKSAETVRKYCEQNLNYLVKQDVKALVVACNTASTQVHESTYQGLPVYNVIDPGAILAVRNTENKKVGVLATRATIKAATYTQKIQSLDPSITVLSQACPLFVHLAEEGWHDDPITNLIAYRYLQKLKESEVDTVVLGCTHYPLLKSAIRRVFGNYVKLIDSGQAVALQMQYDFSDPTKLVPNLGLDTKLGYSKSELKIALTDKSDHFESLSSELLATVSVTNIKFETVSVI